MLPAWGIVASARASRGMVEELRPHHIGTDVKSECADRGLVFIGRSGVHRKVYNFVDYIICDITLYHGRTKPRVYSGSFCASVYET